MSARQNSPTLLDPPDAGTKDVAVVPQQPSVGDSLILMFERLARDPSVDVDKLERLIQAQERILRYNAETAFNEAFNQMQAELPTIIERAKADKSSYAPLEDIVEQVRPILKKYGFSLSHQTEWPDKATVKVIGILTHVQGHSRRSEFQAGADQSGSKNAIQALASTVSYGKRYSTKDLLLIVTRGEDDDARSSDKAKRPEPPAGYDEWVLDMAAKAEEGPDAYAKAWNESKGPCRTYAVEHDKATVRKWREHVESNRKAKP